MLQHNINTILTPTATIAKHSGTSTREWEERGSYTHEHEGTDSCVSSYHFSASASNRSPSATFVGSIELVAIGQP